MSELPPWIREGKTFKEWRMGDEHADKVIVVHITAHAKGRNWCIWPGNPDYLRDGVPGVPVSMRHMAMLYPIDLADVGDHGGCSVPTDPQPDRDLRGEYGLL